MVNDQKHNRDLSAVCEGCCPLVNFLCFKALLLFPITVIVTSYNWAEKKIYIFYTEEIFVL